MRRQRGEGGVYQRHDHPTCPPAVNGVRAEHACRGTWVGNLDLGYGGGKRRRKVVYGHTQKDVLSKLTDAKKQRDKHGATLPTAGMTVEAWFQVWLGEIVPNKERMTPGTLKAHRFKARRYVVPAIGKVRLDRLEPAHVRQVHAYVTDTLGLSLSTARAARGVLSAALNDAVREQLVGRNVALLVDVPAASRRGGRTALTVPAAVQLLHKAADDRLGSRWMAALLLGSRQGELLGLEWDRVDFGHDGQGGTIDLSWQLQRAPYRHGCVPPGTPPSPDPGPCGFHKHGCPDKQLDVPAGFVYRRLHGNLVLQGPKTDSSIRMLPLLKPLELALRLRHDAYLAERADYERDHGLVWCRPDGKALEAKHDSAAWKALLKAAGLPPMDQHAARHTTATLLLALGVPEAVIEAILGHSDAVTTRGYQHIDLTMQRSALDQLAGKLELS